MRSASALSRLARCRSRQEKCTMRFLFSGLAIVCHSCCRADVSLGGRQRSWAGRNTAEPSGTTAAVSSRDHSASTRGAASSSLRSSCRGKASRGRPGSSLELSPDRDRAIRHAASLMRAAFHSPLMIALRSLFSFQGAFRIPGTYVCVCVGKNAQNRPVSSRDPSSRTAHAKGTDSRA